MGDSLSRKSDHKIQEDPIIRPGIGPAGSINRQGTTIAEKAFALKPKPRIARPIQLDEKNMEISLFDL